MINIYSSNRLQARKILSAWYPSVEVRGWPMAKLEGMLRIAIQDGRISEEAAQRFLDSREAHYDASAADDGNHAGRSSEAEADAEAEAQDSDGSDNETEEQQPADESQAEPPADGLSAMIQAMIDAAIGKHTKAAPHGAAGRTRNVQIIAPGEKPREIAGAHKMLPDVLRYLAAGLNVALVGPAGSGKSTIAAQCAEALGLEFRGCGALLSKYDLVGYQDAAGAYHETPFFQAYTAGHLFCFDELDASAPDAVVAFNAATDNQAQFAFPHGMFPKHAKFRAVACMNTWGNGATADYVGRFKQDAAAMSRYVRVLIDYDTDLEAGLGDADIVKRVYALRKSCDELGVRHVVSTRMILQAQAAHGAGVKAAQIDRDVLFAGLPADTVKQLQARMVTA